MPALSYLVILFFIFCAVYDGESGQFPETKATDISGRSFGIGHASDVILKDGLPFRYISGTIHYFRVHPLDWRDRIVKIKHAGCNVLETYIEWSSHEPEPEVYDFSGILNITDYLTIAQEEGFLVVLRPGPYICAERDMGGFPYWLLRVNPTMKLRTNDPSYLYYVDRWFGVLLPMIEPFLYQNGGPVIMVQIENEYGSYASCDFAYTAHLRDLTKLHLGNEIQLFTTDGDSTNYLKCGKIANVYATIDFGSETNATKAFESQRLFEPTGPLINSEYYPGWLDHWGEPHSTRSSSVVASTLDEILSLNASVNIYVFHGGTNFGLTAGANLGSKYQAVPTSYDYDSPLNEAGDPTEKFYAIRNVTEKYVSLPPGPVPSPSPKYAYGDCTLTPVSDLFWMLGYLPSVTAKWPLSFEALSLFNGLVVYQTNIPHMITDPSRLSLYEIHDRGYVFVDEEFVGIVSREHDIYEIPIFGRVADTITIIVESQGRVGYGPKINDFKGLLTNATLGTHVLENWKMTLVPLNNVSMIQNTLDRVAQRIFRFRSSKVISESAEMSFYVGNFDVPYSNISVEHPMDTFLRLDGWSKGYAYINDFLLGRYWPVVGPQVTLYVPHGVLQEGSNSIIVFELETSPCSSGRLGCVVSLVDRPEIDGVTPEI